MYYALAQLKTSVYRRTIECLCVYVYVCFRIDDKKAAKLQVLNYRWAG